MFKRILKLFFYLFVVVLFAAVTAYFAMVYYVDSQLAKRDATNAYNKCQKVWAARGVYDQGVQVKIKRNSIESVAKAFALGAGGVEIDIFYLPEEGHFVVSHDRPDMSKPQLILKEMFDAVGVSTEGYFWLDYKNIEDLSATETEQAIARLKAISADGNLRSRLYVEDSHPPLLTQYGRAGFNTILDAQLPPDSWPVSRFVADLYRAAYYFGDYTVIGTAYGKLDDPIYGPDMRKALGDLPVFLYHVPDETALLNELVTLDTVRVLLVGRDKSVVRFELDRCSGQ